MTLCISMYGSQKQVRLEVRLLSQGVRSSIAGSLRTQWSREQKVRSHSFQRLHHQGVLPFVDITVDPMAAEYLLCCPSH